MKLQSLTRAIPFIAICASLLVACKKEPLEWPCQNCGGDTLSAQTKTVSLVASQWNRKANGDFVCYLNLPTSGPIIQVISMKVIEVLDHNHLVESGTSYLPEGSIWVEIFSGEVGLYYRSNGGSIPFDAITVELTLLVRK